MLKGEEEGEVMTEITILKGDQQAAMWSSLLSPISWVPHPTNTQILLYNIRIMEKQSRISQESNTSMDGGIIEGFHHHTKSIGFSPQ
jgi:hypothetical protein